MQQKIAIFYQTETWALILFDELLQLIPKEFLDKSIRAKHNLQIRLKDGTVIKFIYANASARGHRFHQGYIQTGISIEIYQQIILPMNSLSIRPIYLIEKPQDILCPKQTANDYYYTQEIK